jgi:hypothetical protein
MPPVGPLVRIVSGLLATATVFAGSACSGSGSPAAPGGGERRGFRMGFSAVPPRPNEADLLRALDLWMGRADAAILHEAVPWAALLAGTPPEEAVRALHLPLVQLYRSRGLEVVFTIDVANGLDRASEDQALVALGRSVTEPGVQDAYRAYALAVASVLRPTHLGLAAETNLIRALAPRPVYDAIVTMTNAAAVDLTASGFQAPLYVSIQVDTAWGRLPAGPFLGIETDLQDFPFVTELGLSSYPYLAGFAEPEQVPLDYYARLQPPRGLPLLVVEGGWTSAAVGALPSSAERQARWIRRQFELVREAAALFVFQLLFADLDLAALGEAGNPQLLPFATIGLVTSDLVTKPALAEWDAVFAEPRQ